MKKLFKHCIPGVIEGMIQRKDAKRASAHTGKLCAVVYTQQSKEQPIHVFRAIRKSGLPKQGFYVVRGQPEYDLKGEWCIFSFHQLKRECAVRVSTKRSHIVLW